jgi:hypothetical protein
MNINNLADDSRRYQRQMSADFLIIADRTFVPLCVSFVFTNTIVLLCKSSRRLIGSGEMVQSFEYCRADSISNVSDGLLTRVLFYFSLAQNIYNSQFINISKRLSIRLFTPGKNLSLVNFSFQSFELLPLKSALHVCFSRVNAFYNLRNGSENNELFLSGPVVLQYLT